MAAAGDSAELALIEGASHPALYDVEEYVAQAVERLDDFFAKSLGA